MRFIWHLLCFPHINSRTSLYCLSFSCREEKLAVGEKSNHPPFLRLSCLSSSLWFQQACVMYIFNASDFIKWFLLHFILFCHRSSEIQVKFLYLQRFVNHGLFQRYSSPFIHLLSMSDSHCVLGNIWRASGSQQPLMLCERHYHLLKPESQLGVTCSLPQWNLTVKRTNYCRGQ